MFLDLILRHRLPVVALGSILVIVASYGAIGIQISTDNRVFYGPNNKYFLDQLAFEDEFTANDNVLFVIAAPYSVVDQEFPAAVRWLDQRARLIPHSIRVDSLWNYPRPALAPDGTVVVQSLLDWACDTDPTDCNEPDGLFQPHIVNRMISPDGTATGVLATLAVERGVVGLIEEVLQHSRQIAEEFRAEFPDFEIYFTGGVPMMAAFAEATAEDLGVLLPIALALISVLLYLVLGSLRLAAAIVALGMLSIGATIGIAGWAGLVINNATSIVPLIVFTLVVASSMHIAVHFSRNLPSRATRDETFAQAKASVSSNLTPIAISAFTSAVSLCSLWTVDSPPIRELGILSALGVLIGCFLTLTVLPVLLTLVGKTTNRGLNALVQHLVNRYARLVEEGEEYNRYYWLVLLVCLAGLSQLRINEDFVHFFDESIEFRVHTDRATELLAGPNHIELVLRNPSGSAFDPAFLRHLDALGQFVRSQPAVANVHSFADVMKEIANSFASKELSQISSSDELAQLFLVYELSLQIGQSNTDLINNAQDAARASVLLKHSTSSDIQGIESAVRAWHTSTASMYELVVTGENIPVAHLSMMNIKSMLAGIAASLAFTALVVGLTFRSLRLSLVTLLATVVPVMAGFGIWGWINTDIGLAATAIIALTIGVVVDDAAHYIYRFIDAQRRLELDAKGAAAYATHRAGTAIVGTSVVMGVGLSLLMLSSFEVNSNFGTVTCLIIATALAFNFAFLPRLMMWQSNHHITENTD